MKVGLTAEQKLIYIVFVNKQIRFYSFFQVEFWQQKKQRGMMMLLHKDGSPCGVIVWASSRPSEVLDILSLGRVSEHIFQCCFLWWWTCSQHRWLLFFGCMPLERVGPAEIAIALLVCFKKCRIFIGTFCWTQATLAWHCTHTSTLPVLADVSWDRDYNHGVFGWMRPEFQRLPMEIITVVVWYA